jgi:hypothetical protein
MSVARELFPLRPAGEPMAAPSISHDREEETIEAKARWFQSLTIEERLRLFDEMTELALALNPRLPDLKDAEPSRGSRRILSPA